MNPLGAIYALHSGLPDIHRDFWNHFSIEHLFKLYVALNATPDIVISKIVEPEQCNSACSRVFAYLLLIHFIGNMKQDELRQFLRFVTGSSVLITKAINVYFNSLQGIARRPISHTCSCTLELSVSYTNYLDFEQEFCMVLSSKDA